MKLRIDGQRLQAAYATARQRLLSLRNASGYWTGRLSTSALSTATAVMALYQVQQHREDRSQNQALQDLIARGLAWLAEHQNPDGGWGDTVKSYSNISTTMLAHAVFHAVGRSAQFDPVREKAQAYIAVHGGAKAVVARYGQDKTFSVPILTHCALAGLVDWREVPALPFEQACLPHRFYAAIGLPVVSYALPALIAIGQVRHHFRKPLNPLTNWLREACIPRSLRILKRIQPSNGGFLEAAPLTSFVTMSLAAKGLADHPVVKKGVEFLEQSALPDGSWPIDTNLATWVTTLSVNALGEDLPEEDRPPIRDWLLGQQYQEIHPYTQAAPGGWAWTDLPGGVPDADDTPGALLALLALDPQPDFTAPCFQNGVQWLVELQNRDGGWPTFCWGWGALPFDRSAADITAHVLRALTRWRNGARTVHGPPYPDVDVADGGTLDDAYRVDDLLVRSEAAISRGFQYLDKAQREDGSWLPLWFGNQDAPDDINPTYGTARVLAAYAETGRIDALPAREGFRWLRSHQNEDGGWGGVRGAPSSVEETALAVQILLEDWESADEVERGLEWLLARVESGEFVCPSPIGFYFAKLWYFEDLYPVIFTVGALRRACARREGTQGDPPTKSKLKADAESA